MRKCHSVGVSIIDLPQRRSVAETRAFHTIRLLSGFPFADSSKSFIIDTYLSYLISSLMSTSI